MQGVDCWLELCFGVSELVMRDWRGVRFDEILVNFALDMERVYGWKPPVLMRLRGETKCSCREV